MKRMTSSHPLPAAPVADGLQLQVLAGPQQGARAPVPAGSAFTVGGSADCDIVLRGLATLPVAVRLCLQPGGLGVEVLRGEVTVAGETLAAGQQRVCGADADLVLGPVRFGLFVAPADGAPAADAAAQADGPVEVAAELSDSPPQPARPVGELPGADAISPEPTPPDPRSPDPRPAGRRGWQALLAGGAALATVSIGMLASAYTQPMQPAADQQPEASSRQAQAVLQAAGLRQLQVRPDPEGGGLLVSGYLDTGAQRAQAEQLLAAQPLPARWQVHVNQQVADAVADVYRINGVPAQARPVGEGAVAVTTREADERRLDRVRDAARRDVPGLAAIEARNLPPPAPPAAAPVLDDPGKRVASIVPGEPPYVVTADGTRYFEGALLPTGHRIAGIERHRVLLDRDGAVTPLVF